MSDMNKLLAARTSQKKNKNKIVEMARRSSTGNLTSFSGVFTLTDLDAQDKEDLEKLLRNYSDEDASVDISADLKELVSLTCEIKAITNQALLLHGERINKAQKILTCYKDGAFTAWLIVAYGNRQTPYNFLHYYLFYMAITKDLKPLLEQMPRQAVYTLASRQGELSEKEEIVASYAGETKLELLKVIRNKFPLDFKDKRGFDFLEVTMKALQKIRDELKAKNKTLSPKQKLALIETLNSMARELKS